MLFPTDQCDVNCPDYVSFDSNDHIAFHPDYIVDSELPRSSKDSACNNYGRELLDLCNASNLNVMGILGKKGGLDPSHVSLPVGKAPLITIKGH